MNNNLKIKVLLLIIVLACVVALVVLGRTSRKQNPIANFYKMKHMKYLTPAGKSTTESRWAPEYSLTQLEKILNKNGYRVSQSLDRSAFWTNNIHLCINFNLARMAPKPEDVNTLILFYYPFFKDITIIFDSIPERPPYIPKFVDYVSCKSYMGWYQQKCINLCMQRGNDKTAGHFYTADDIFLNLTRMSDLPIEKMWFTNMAPKNYSWILDPGPKGWGWQWWGKPYNNSPKLKNIIDGLSPEKKQLLIDKAGFPEKFKIVATSDLIYVPKSLVPEMSKNLAYLDNVASTLFCEIATCLAVDLSNADPIMLNYGYIWGGKTTQNIEKMAKTAHFVHPVKLGVPGHHELWIKYMTEQLCTIIGESGINSTKLV